MIALMLTLELLTSTLQSHRAITFGAAVKQASTQAGVRVVSTPRYQGRSDVLMLWGPGAPDRFEAMRAQVAAGRHVVALDLAYWHRDTKIRISIDAAHPQRWVMRRDWPMHRFAADRVPVSETWNPQGPVIVAGIGRKARVQYGADVVERWETEMLHAAAARWGRPVRYRRKQLDAPIPDGATLASDQPIDRVLAGASLLITWHSNVAVDAIRLGIPVVCRDGAAAAVCGSTLPDVPRPLDPWVRDRFLANLAWFQWQPTEARTFLRWLPEVLA